MTQEELARKIGVSRATLDRVINNREGVSAKRGKRYWQLLKSWGINLILVAKCYPSRTGHQLELS